MSKIRRRDLLKATAAGSAGLWLGAAPAMLRADSANNRLNIAVIGIGGRGLINLNSLGRENIVAVCDVDDKQAALGYSQFPKAKKFYDFRKMYDEMGARIDAVVISTPDHCHFHPALLAMRMGKHVYLEKPMAHSVWEVRELTKLAAEKKLATQLGVQRHTMDGVRKAVELIQSGAIGAVRECHSWMRGGRGMPPIPTSAMPVPEHLKWDLWLGPAAQRPYHSAYVPYNWRFWWDFGTGDTGNWGCHILDIPFWALGLKYPAKVRASGPDPHAQTTPKTMSAQLEFPAEGKRPAMTLHWYQGSPPILEKLGLKGGNNLFIGDKGMLLCDFERCRLLPEKDFKDYRGPEPFLPKSPGFHNEWINACKGGPAPSCNFSYTGPLTETILLSNVAFRAQGGFDWDHVQLKPVGNDKAQHYIHPVFRKGWEV